MASCGNRGGCARRIAKLTSSRGGGCKPRLFSRKYGKTDWSDDEKHIEKISLVKMLYLQIFVKHYRRQRIVGQKKITDN